MNYKNYAKNIKNSTGLEALIGAGVSSNVNVTEGNALKNSDIVYSCINLIASTIAKMPISLYEETAEGKVKISDEVSYLLKTRSNETTSAIDFKQAMFANMLLWGNAYAYIETKRGIPSNLIILDPSLTKLEKLNNKLFVITSIDNKQYKIKYEQVIHIKDLNTDGLNGISRIKTIKGKLENKVASDTMLKNFYTTGGTGVKGILNVPSSLTSEAKRKLKYGFNEVLNSDASGIAVLDDGITFTGTSKMSLSDSDFVNNMKLTKEDICGIFGVPTSMIGDSANTSYNNLTEFNRNFIESLVIHIEKFEAEANYKLLTSDQRLSRYFKFNVSVALRSSDLDRADFYNKMISMGAFSINEIRELEDRNKIEGGDEYYRSLNYVPLSIANEYQLAKAKFGNGDIKTKDE